MFKNINGIKQKESGCSCEKCSCNDELHHDDFCEDVKCNDCENEPELEELCLCGGCSK